MAYQYATQNMTDKMARASRTGLAISTKQSIEIANRIRGKQTTVAQKYLEEVISMDRPVKLTRFNWNAGHKPGIGPGRYPVTAAAEFLRLLKLTIANAAHKSLDTSRLRIFNVVAQRGPKSYKPSRTRGLKSKVTHLEIVLEEFHPKKAASKNASAKTAKSAAKQ
ncbi:MAG TPA: 50S ribosomal protein L22 [Acidobacteriota bacterium]|nr:50S ribosomal protein L22 [Acidobacteriota bacterium]